MLIGGLAVKLPYKTMFGSYILRATCRSCLAFPKLILSGLGTCRDFMSVQSSQARVSSVSQNLDRQIEAFKKDGADERDIITEKKSGKGRKRV